MLGDLDCRLGNLVVAAELANSPDAASDLLDQTHAVEHAEQERISGDALCAQILFAHPGWQAAGAHDLQSIMEEVGLYIRRGSVVSMGDGID